MKLVIHRDESDKDMFHVYRVFEPYTPKLMFSLTRDNLNYLVKEDGFDRAMEYLDCMAYDDHCNVEVTIRIAEGEIE